MTTITTAQSEYYSRPPDERFPSIEALVSAAAADQARSIERTYSLRDLRAAEAPGSAGRQSSLVLQSPKGAAAVSHWALSQLASTAGAPAAYIRTLPPALAAQCLNHGLAALPKNQTSKLLIRTGGSLPLVRAVNGPAYGRAFDAQVLGAVHEQLVSKDSKWALPPTWDGVAAGAYRGDRDSFLIICNGGSIVNDPSAGSNGAMYRGLMIRNSEVGAASLVIERVLYRFVCGNHCLWGAIIDQSFRRRHVGDAVLSDALREISAIAYQWASQSAGRDEAIIRSLISNEIASTRDDVIAALVGFGASKSQATAAYDACESSEEVSPRSWWGAAQGLTRASQTTTYQGDRYELDQLAAAVLARGARLGPA